jgi:2-polyprenyl-6-methoxyphenol hydroxylase-like FAD-dependent oxidoreductase
MDVIVVGGGIGGLASALFLHQRGFSVQVHEAVPEVRELGVGINIQPHAIRELDSIGLLDAVVAAGNPCRSWALFNRWGQLIWREPRGTDAGHEWPQVSISRGRLQGLLLEAVEDRLGADAVRTDRRLVGFEMTDAGVEATFASRTGDSTTDRGDVLLGADGIHSTVRRTFYPDEGDPQFGGQILWRGMTRQAPFAGGAEMAFAGYADQKLIAYPITPADQNGECLVNWIAEVRADKILHREDWNRRGQLEDFLPLYEDWQFSWLDVPALMRNAYAVYEFPMVDRDPLPRWSFGRTTLLGDAAHPMYPIGANGASQAIRDGSAVARALAEHDDPVAALAAYEDERRPVTNEIVLQNRQLGPERVMQIAHERAPDGFDDVEDVMTREELESISQSYRKVTWAEPSAK